MSDEPKCPFPHEKVQGAKALATGESARKWWPNQVSVDALQRNGQNNSPFEKDFDYAKAYSELDLENLKSFVFSLITNSGPRYEEAVAARGLDAMPYGQKYWWPADWGHYGPLFIRLAWHAAGTYRVSDGRGGAGRGMIRMAPLNSWPDNVNLDKAMRILWPAKERFGDRISWADLFILAGNIALESMGFKALGFAAGRIDSYEEDDTYWGNETAWLANERHREQTILDNPLAATHMGLIYVNPEGPDGNAEDFTGAARDIRITFGRMAMNDEETVALIAGGHAFGKAHGNGDPSKVGEPPAGAPIEQIGFGWKNANGKGNAEDTVSSGLEGAWTPTPTTWDNKYLELLYKYEWQKVLSPAGAQQWEPIDCQPEDMVPDAHVEGKMNKPMMLTTDLALRFGDPDYDRIARSFAEDFDRFSDVFAKAWFKLTHRDMGPLDRYLGDEVPEEVFTWQDPIHKNTFPEITDRDINNLRGNIIKELETTGITLSYNNKGYIENRKLDVRDLVFTAWVSASTYRDSDRRGGANGARILLEPMKSWEFVDYERAHKTVTFLTQIRDSLKIEMSIADLIVAGGNIGVEILAKNAGFELKMPFVGGRGDATQDQIDVESVGHLEPVHDGFLNWTKVKRTYGDGDRSSSAVGDEDGSVGGYFGVDLSEDDLELLPILSNEDTQENVSEDYPILYGNATADSDVYVELSEDSFILDEFAEYLIIERADLLNLTPKELVALLTVFRSASIYHRSSVLNRDSMYSPGDNWKIGTEFLEHMVLKSWYAWEEVKERGNTEKVTTYDHPATQFVGNHLHPDAPSAFRASRVDLLFASNPILRGICEFYTQAGGLQRLVDDFASAWNKVMMLDRYDVKR